MVFNSNIFLYAFLPCCIFVYYITDFIFRKQPEKTCSNLVLLGFSCLFYLYGSGRYFFLLAAVVFADYAAALAIERAERHRKRLLQLAAVLNIALLVFFKYSGFIGLTQNLILPIGISFYIFQAVSYLADVYSRKIKAQKNLFKWFLYISFFPQLIAGPVIRYQDVSFQIESRTSGFINLYRGICRFITGLGKKVLIADVLAISTDKIFLQPKGQLTPFLCWSAALFYTLEIYFDFSGYSDMAVGLAEMFGFHFSENFDRPYLSRNITQFWRKWHISLSSWLRDYVYIPLGGSRGGAAAYRNQMIVFLICGLWHGAGWTFLVWGIYHGILIMIEKFLFERYSFCMKSYLGTAVTFFFVSGGWIIFRSGSMGQCLDFFKVMFGISTSREFQYFGYTYFVTVQTAVTAAAAVMLVFLPVQKIMDALKKRRAVFYHGILMGILIASMIYMSDASFRAFIYFQF